MRILVTKMWNPSQKAAGIRPPSRDAVLLVGS